MGQLRVLYRSMLFNRVGYDWAWNLTLFTSFFMIFSLASITCSAEVLSEEDFIQDGVFSKRPQRFSFGLGKRAVNPDLSPQDLSEMMAQMKGWGMSGPHGLFKRSVEQSSEDMEELLALKPWGASHPHGLFKRSDSPSQEDLENLLSRLRGWGAVGPHGLFKRGDGSSQTDLETLYRNMGRWGLSGPHGLFKRSQETDLEQFIKRGAYSFGLGKRSGNHGKRGQYNFGLGKRGQYSFGLGKRPNFGMGKRDPYGFGLGK